MARVLPCGECGPFPQGVWGSRARAQAPNNDPLSHGKSYAHNPNRYHFSTTQTTHERSEQRMSDAERLQRNYSEDPDGVRFDCEHCGARVFMGWKLPPAWPCKACGKSSYVPLADEDEADGD